MTTGEDRRAESDEETADASALAPEFLLRLQSTAGNRAVAGLLASRRSSEDANGDIRAEYRPRDESPG